LRIASTDMLSLLSIFDYQVHVPFRYFGQTKNYLVTVIA